MSTHNSQLSSVRLLKNAEQPKKKDRRSRTRDKKILTWVKSNGKEQIQVSVTRFKLERQIELLKSLIVES